MKDAQTDQSGQQAYIPIISPALHVLAMPALVFLRSTFGYLYLRPRSIFLALCLASTLLFIVIFNEPALWAAFAAPVIFSFATACLYSIHLAVALLAQVREDAAADTYSGKSHILRVLPQREDLELHVHLWLEPLLVLAVAVVSRIAFSQPLLASWLFITALALALKELRTYWSELRRRKRRKDMQDETTEEAEVHSDGSTPKTPKKTRKPKQRHDRHSGDSC